jgi:hypothetical protein
MAADTAYCYHCSKHHPIEEMRQLVTKTGKRWRCIKSIEATKADRKTRDAFGQRITEINKAESASKARIVLNAGKAATAV